MADYGIKIAKSGYGISETDPARYHFWSKYAGRSIRYQGTLSLTTNTGTDPADAVASYTHSFGYVPQFAAFTTSVFGGYIQVPFTAGAPFGKSGDLEEEHLKVRCTTSIIEVAANLSWFTPMSGFSTGIAQAYTFDILLFMEEALTS